MYAIGGINHQANMTVSLRESDLEVTKVRSGTLYAVNDRTTGYVSHSFNQFILADRNGDLFTLDHGTPGPVPWSSSGMTRRKGRRPLPAGRSR